MSVNMIKDYYRTMEYYRTKYEFKKILGVTNQIFKDLDFYTSLLIRINTLVFLFPQLYVQWIKFLSSTYFTVSCPLSRSLFPHVDQQPRNAPKVYVGAQSYGNLQALYKLPTSFQKFTLVRKVRPRPTLELTLKKARVDCTNSCE